MSEDKKNKIFWIVFTLLVMGPVLMMYFKVFVYRDYVLVKEVACDPTSESCFVYTPEDLCAESEESDCLSNTVEEYYKIIHKNASQVESCNPSTLEEGDSCPELVCEPGEEDCYYEYNEDVEDAETNTIEDVEGVIVETEGVDVTDIVE